MQTFFYRFESREAFREAAVAAGWGSGLEGELLPAAGTAFVEIGPLIAAPTMGAAGRPIPGGVIDGRWHVNVLWPGDAEAASFAAARVEPEAPVRAFAVEPAQLPAAPPVPGLVAAWKGKAVLRAMGLLDAAEAAVAAAGGDTAIAWRDAAEWERGSAMLAGMAAVLKLGEAEVDALFRQAAAVKA